ncbi:amidohydrolase family protein [Clostridium sp. MCC353]|uniref:amidohydrolase n=1 Tax=Clostridium sp. MCC353 TaxID=2592646 RepID=UPI001C0141B4|nr:amidohydrolase [Clostridium sp. MCC353]MBT9776624.1 amidohydrolase family protein [Clostridium sp. MCC353]
MRTLIENTTVLTMDSAYRVLEQGYVVINDTIIEKTGAGPCGLPWDKKIDGTGKILMPGMINCHSHMSMIPFRSMGDDCPDRLRRFLFPLELEAMTPELVRLSARYAVCEMLLAGVTTVLDMYYFENEVAKACDELGIRGYLGETVINMETCDSKTPYGGLQYGETFLRSWNGHELITPLIAPHAPNTNSPEMLQRAFQLSREYDTFYTLHVSEMDYEMEYFREQYKKTPIEFLYDLGVLGEKTIAAHCIHMTKRDLELLSQTGTKVVHCIGSNTKAGKGTAPVRDMKAAGIQVGLGTDGPSSGNTLDLFTQFRLFASFQKTRYRDRSLFPAKDIIALGTIGGARVLGADGLIGSIETGKKADLVMVETGSVNMFPVYNPYSALVYSANASNVDTVFVNGKLLVSNKKMVNADLNEIKADLSAAMEPFRKLAAKYEDMI